MTTTAKNRARRPSPPGGRARWPYAAVAVVAVVAVVLAGLFAVYRHASSTAPGGASRPGDYQVGQPGVGATAPAIRLPAATGGTVDLASYQGKTVLLYFQEGLSCQPCWDQLRDLEAAEAQLHAAGIDSVLSVTTDPANLLAQKVRDEHLRSPVVSDSQLAVSSAYHANDYGMMGDSRDGHTFILVGPDGHIRWRADYGGAPRFTMYVPVSRLLADLRAGQRRA